MPRARLTEAEREARRKARARFSFSDAAYDHYDPRTESFGSWESWQATAEALAGGKTRFRADTQQRQQRTNPDATLLGLSAIPDRIEDLKAAFRVKARETHPDLGGTAVAFRAVFAAYERLLKFFA